MPQTMDYPAPNCSHVVAPAWLTTPDGPRGTRSCISSNIVVQGMLDVEKRISAVMGWIWHRFYVREKKSGHVRQGEKP